MKINIKIKEIKREIDGMMKGYFKFLMDINK